jgi:hypothetical protein
MLADALLVVLMSAINVSIEIELGQAADTHVLGVHCGNGIVAHVTRRRGLTIGHRHWMRSRKACLLCHTWELSAHLESVSAGTLRVCRGCVGGLKVGDVWSTCELTFGFFCKCETPVADQSPISARVLQCDAGVCTY